MSAKEQAVAFDCDGDVLVGILSEASAPASRGVLIVVGGPQYRAGSHRQFTLLARHLAECGVPSFRFDYRGMGDSAGEKRGFEDIAADIGAAIDEFFARMPGLRDVVIWGLCDAASAALMYAHTDARVSGLVLLNPWVHGAQSGARVYLRHYYLKRLFQASLWRKIASGQFSVRKAANGFVRVVNQASGRQASNSCEDKGMGAPGSTDTSTPFVARMKEGLRRFRGPVLLILSGKDFTAQEFKDLVATSSDWRRLLAKGRITRRDLHEANHTFSNRAWRDQIADWTEQWIRSW